MNQNQKTAAALLVTGVGVTVFAIHQFKQMNVQMAQRFPEIDPKIARKAWRRMTSDAVRGKYHGFTALTDETLDAIFLEEVRKLTEK